MKKIAALTAALAMAASLTVPVQAKEEMTVDKVKELLYASSIANSEDSEELLSYEYILSNSDDINDTKKLEELGDASRSFKVFSIIAPDEWNTYYDYSEGDILDYFAETEQSGSRTFYMEKPDDPSSYYWICVYGDGGEYSDDGQTFELESLAEAINEAGLEGVSDIRMCSGFYYIKADGGEFAVSEYDETNPRRDDEPLVAWTAYPLKDYLIFITDKALDETNARKAMEEKMDQVEIPAEFVFEGDEPRETNYFAEYEFTENPFSDTDGMTAKAASLLYDLGVTKGVGGGLYDPEASLTVEQAGTMLERLMKNDSKYIDGFDGSETLSAVDAANMLLRLTGRWTLTVDGDSMFFYADWIFGGIESFDASTPVSRGDFAVMLCNALDRPMTTYIADGGYSLGAEVLMMQGDITLIDYINGGKLNGVYVTSQEEQDAWENKYYTWYYNAYGDIIYEYSGENNPFIEVMEKYGWTRPEKR